MLGRGCGEHLGPVTKTKASWGMGCLKLQTSAKEGFSIHENIKHFTEHFLVTAVVPGCSFIQQVHSVVWSLVSCYCGLGVGHHLKETAGVFAS